MHLASLLAIVGLIPQMNLSASCLLTSQIVLFIQIIVKGFTALIA
jgi:hypothetical protein